MPAIIYKAADRSEEMCLAHIGILGPKQPPKLPAELAMPMPAAAAVAAKNADGNGQNNAIDPMTPRVPMDKKIMAKTGLEAKIPLKTKPMAPATTLNT